MRLAHPPSRPEVRPSGFTLVELVVALAVMAIILLATQSVVLLAVRAVPDERSGPSAVLAAGRALDRLADDLGLAATVTKATTTEVILTVPDRNGDGQDETLRYSWSGTAGDPLLRQVNGGTAVAIAQGVQDFRLAYDQRTDPLPGTSSEGLEIKLINAESGSATDYTVDTQHWGGEFFAPALPAGTVAWRVTRVKFQARVQGDPNGQTLVQIRTADAGLPSNTVLDQAVLLESSLGSSYQWMEFAFANAGNLDPTTTLCLVLQFAANSPSCQVQQLSNSATNFNSVSTDNGGSSWSASGGKTLRLQIYGTVSTANPTSYRNVLTGVRCTLRVGGDTPTAVSTAVRLLNEPEAPPP